MLNLPTILIKYIVSFDESIAFYLSQTCKKLRSMLNKRFVLKISAESGINTYYLGNRKICANYFGEIGKYSIIKIHFISLLDENRIVSILEKSKTDFFNFLHVNSFRVYLKDFDMQKKIIDLDGFKNLFAISLNVCYYIREINNKITVLNLVFIDELIKFPNTVKIITINDCRPGFFRTLHNKHIEKVYAFKSRTMKNYIDMIQDKLEDKFVIID
jgi:hypothetical protein